MQARLRDSVSGRYRAAENFLLTKHVVAAGKFAKDAGSTPAASTILKIAPERRREGSRPRLLQPGRAGNSDQANSAVTQPTVTPALRNFCNDATLQLQSAPMN